MFFPHTHKNFCNRRMSLYVYDFCKQYVFSHAHEIKKLDRRKCLYVWFFVTYCLFPTQNEDFKINFFIFRATPFHFPTSVTRMTSFYPQINEILFRIKNWRLWIISRIALISFLGKNFCPDRYMRFLFFLWMGFRIKSSGWLRHGVFLPSTEQERAIPELERHFHQTFLFLLFEPKVVKNHHIGPKVKYLSTKCPRDVRQLSTKCPGCL